MPIFAKPILTKDRLNIAVFSTLTPTRDADVSGFGDVSLNRLVMQLLSKKVISAESYAGDFARLYRETYDRLVRILWCITRDEGEAQDIVHNAFVKLWERRGEMPMGSPAGFVKTVAINAARDFLRKRRVHQKYIDEITNSDTPSDYPADSNIISIQTARVIEMVVESMPPQRRQVYKLGKVEGLTYDEIAQRMGISNATVNRHMTLAMKEVREVVPVVVMIMLMCEATR